MTDFLPPTPWTPDGDQADKDKKDGGARLKTPQDNADAVAQVRANIPPEEDQEVAYNLGGMMEFVTSRTTSALKTTTTAAEDMAARADQIDQDMERRRTA